MYNLWCIISIAILTSAKTTDVTCSFQSNYVHEFVLIIANNICCTPQVFESQHMYVITMGIPYYMLIVHVHCIVFVTILYYDMYISVLYILVNTDQYQKK